MNVAIHEEAKDEAASHIAWFAQRSPRTAERLAELFVEAVEQIARNPQQFPLLEYAENPGNVRRARLKNFPLIVLYQVFEDEAYVFSVAHTSRQPSYWQYRLRG
jgi:toxin ParE1/3/4